MKFFFLLLECRSAMHSTSYVALFCLATAALCAPSVHPQAMGQAAQPEDLIGELEQVQATEQKGSAEKLRVMLEMARNQKAMMAQLRRVGGQAHRAEQERDAAQQAELSQCRADLSSANARLTKLRRPRVSDLHRLLSPRGAMLGRHPPFATLRLF